MTTPAPFPTTHVLHVVVRGRVQGVGFRIFTHAAAMRLGVTGWVRNTADGAVEILAEGTEMKLVDLLTEVSKGPPWSHVAELEPVWRKAPPQFDDFKIRR